MDGLNDAAFALLGSWLFVKAAASVGGGAVIGYTVKESGGGAMWGLVATACVALLAFGILTWLLPEAPF